VARQQRCHELLAERPGAAGDQDRFAVKHALLCTIAVPRPESGRFAPPRRGDCNNVALPFCPAMDCDVR
jgi:hypothetical protein